MKRESVQWHRNAESIPNIACKGSFLVLESQLPKFLYVPLLQF